MSAPTEDAAVELADGERRPARHELSLGRGADNDIRLASKSVSRSHARLVWAGERWCVEDLGSANGTFVNGERIPFGVPRPLRHRDRIRLGDVELVFSWPAEAEDTDRTEPLDVDAVDEALERLDGARVADVRLSPLQQQVVRALCGAWIRDDAMDRVPTNRQIAAQLGTPAGEESVKAALRRSYEKLGLTGLPPELKRRALCRVARERGWL